MSLVLRLNFKTPCFTVATNQQVAALSETNQEPKP
jgi:hypothetical protein